MMNYSVKETMKDDFSPKICLSFFRMVFGTGGSNEKLPIKEKEIEKHEDNFSPKISEGFWCRKMLCTSMSMLPPFFTPAWKYFVYQRIASPVDL